MVVGITGGIGSGKTLLTSFLSEQGFAVYSADEFARKVVQKGTIGLAQITQEFGSEVLLENGELNRKLLGEIVFSNNDKLKALNAITHPLIQSEIETVIKQTKHSNIVFVEVPLLFEAGYQNVFEKIWVVVCDKAIRVARIMMRDKITEKQAIQRIESQMSDEQKCKNADVVIKNNGNIGDFEKVVKSEVQMLKNVLGLER